MWVTLSLRKKELKQEHTYYQLADLAISRQKRQLDRRKRYEQALIQQKQKQDLNPIKDAYDTQVATLNKEKEALSQYLLAIKNIKNNSLSNYYIDGSNKDKIYMKSSSGNYVCQTAGDGGREFSKISDLYYDNESGKYYQSAEDKESGNSPALRLETNSDGAIQNYQLAFDLSKYENELRKYNLSTDLSQFTSESDITTLESSVTNYQSQIQLELQTAYTSYTGATNEKKEIWENELAMLEDEVGEEETQLELEQNDIETQMEYISNELQAIGDAVSQGIQQSTIKLS